MIVCCMRIPKHRMLHQPSNAPRQTSLFGALLATSDEDIFHALSKLKHGSFGWVRLCETVAMLEQLQPVVAVEVVNCATRANQEVALRTELPEDVADTRVEMRIEARVHADERRRRTFLGKHAYEDEICVVDPIKLLVRPRIDTLFSQGSDTFLARLQIGNQFVVFVFPGVHIWHEGLDGFWVHGHVDAIHAACIPVSTHHDNTLKAMTKSLIATGFPIVG